MSPSFCTIILIPSEISKTMLVIAIELIKVSVLLEF